MRSSNEVGALGVGEAVGVGVKEGVGDGVGFFETLDSLLGDGEVDGLEVIWVIFFPTLHTRDLPCLIQVYRFPPEMEICPAFVHLLPDLTAAWEILGRDATTSAVRKTATLKRMIYINAR